MCHIWSNLEKKKIIGTKKVVHLLSFKRTKEIFYTNHYSKLQMLNVYMIKKVKRKMIQLGLFEKHD